jgi:lipoprotein-anchoring transpeptidase ErfK/SrfK
LSAQEGVRGSDRQETGQGGDPEAGTQGHGHPETVASDGHVEAAPRDGEPETAPDGDQPGTPGLSSAGGLGKRPATRVILLAAAIAAVLIGGGVYALGRGGGSSAVVAAAAINPGVTLRGPFRVMSVTPSPGAQQTSGDQPVAVTFSAPVSARSPLPQVSPHIAGNWETDGNTMLFTPAVPFSPSTQVTVTVPGGEQGVRSAAGAALGSPMTAQFSTGSYSVTRLEELLSQLGYLPLSWHQSPIGMRAADPAAASSAASGSTLAGEEALAYDPPDGIFTIQPGYPASLASLWQPDSYNVVLTGAIMAFESQHNMTLNGDASPALWNALFQASIAGTANPAGYTYAVADQNDPETLTIWHNGQVVLTSPANTGIPVSPTVNGTFPVYERFLNQIMSGTNPDGSHYADPVSYVSYFNGGDAVHYFPRGSFGFQQSLGCIELPLAQAQQAYPYLTYGSLVTVTG